MFSGYSGNTVSMVLTRLMDALAEFRSAGIPDEHWRIALAQREDKMNANYVKHNTYQDSVLLLRAFLNGHAILSERLRLYTGTREEHPNTDTNLKMVSIPIEPSDLDTEAISLTNKTSSESPQLTPNQASALADSIISPTGAVHVEAFVSGNADRDDVRNII